MDDVESAEAIAAAVADMRRLHDLAVGREDPSQEATRLRRAIHRRWLDLDAEGRLRLQRAQQDLMAEFFGPSHHPGL